MAREKLAFDRRLDSRDRPRFGLDWLGIHYWNSVVADCPALGSDIWSGDPRYDCCTGGFHRTPFVSGHTGSRSTDSSREGCLEFSLNRTPAVFTKSTFHILIVLVADGNRVLWVRVGIQGSFTKSTFGHGESEDSRYTKDVPSVLHENLHQCPMLGNLVRWGQEEVTV